MTTIEVNTAGRIELGLLACLVLIFWIACGCLAAGVIWWLASPAAAGPGYLLNGGLLGLLVLPLLRLSAILVAAARRRDRVTLAATIAVLAILFALTLRDAAAS